MPDAQHANGDGPLRIRLRQTIGGFLGVLLIWSAGQKAVDGSGVQETLRYAFKIVMPDLPADAAVERNAPPEPASASSRISSAGLAGWNARGLIVLETALGGLLIFGGSGSRFIAAAVLFGSFSLFIVFLLASDAKVGCGCGLTTTNDPVNAMALVRTGGLFAIALVGLGTYLNHWPKPGILLAPFSRRIT